MHNMYILATVPHRLLRYVSAALRPLSALPLLVLLLAGSQVWGQTTKTWTGGSSAAWLTAGNWSASGAPNTTTTEAYFNSNTQLSIGINMNGISTANSSIGSIHFGPNATTARTINNSSGTTAGSMTLNGMTLNSVNNVILRNNSPGTHTLTNGTSNFGITLANATESVIQIDSSGGLTISTAITGAGPLVKGGNGTGVLLLSSNNTYTGATEVRAGRLRLGGANILPNTSQLILSGGTFSSGATTGFSETMGTLSLQNNSTIALGIGSHTLTFSNSSAVSWSSGKTLTITGWTGTAGATGTAGKIMIGAGGLTAAQLTQITFSGYGAAMLLGTGEIVPATVTINGTGVPAIGNLAQGVNNAVFLGFSLTPVVSTSFTAVNIATSGTASASDVSNFRLVRDANANGVYDAGTDVILATTAALANPVAFSSFTENISTATNYLVIADVAAGATIGAKLTCSIAAATAVTTTASETGTATGGEQTFQSSGAPSLSAGALSGFGNVCTATTSSAQTFTITGSYLNTDPIGVTCDNAAYTFCTTAGGTYTTSLSITQGGCSGVACYTQTIYVKLSPVAAGATNGTITVSGGGAATSATTSATGTGVSMPPAIGSPTATDIGTTTATLGGNVTSLGCSNVTVLGVEYSTTSGFANGSGSTVSETFSAYSLGGFTFNVIGLSANTQYYYKALGVNAHGSGYSSEASFYTLSMPATAQPTTFSAAAGASGVLNLTWDNASFPASGATAAGYLLVYSTGTPTLVASPNGLAPASAVSTGTIVSTTATTLPTLPATTVSVTGLTAGQMYNFLLVPYTYNGSAGATYNYLTTSPLTASGTPIGLPSISNVAASSITATGAAAGGTSLNANGGTVSAKGIVWNTSTNPTITTNLGITNEGASTTTFSSTISGLSAQTLYYYRAYITTQAGTSYGTSLSFRTLSNPPTAAPTGLTATAYGATDITLNWTAANYPGSGATANGYIILQRTDGTFPTTAGVTNGTAPGSLSLPGGTTLAAIVTSGATPSQTITGLNALSAYHFLLVPYTWNNSQAATYNYLTIGAPTATATTMATPWEDFEAGTKTSYTTGNVTCKAGSWNFNNSLLGTVVGSDFFNGNQSARIQTSISMNFNQAQGIGTVMLYHGMYGSDVDATWQLEASTNNGSTWTAYISPTYTATSSTFALQTIPVNLQGNVRFRIVKGSGGNRLNIDDIYVTNFALTTGTVTISDCNSATVPFSYTVGPFSGATFTAQLSDATGSFASPVTIGTIASNNSGSQTIAATLPSNRVYGTGYRIRVVSTGPAATGTDNGANLTIYAPLTVSAGADQTVCGATTVNATVSGGKMPYIYDWNSGASANATYSVAAPAPGVPANYHLDVMDDLGCLLSDDVIVAYGAPVAIPTVQGTYSATTAITDGSWTHYCDCPNNLRLLSLEQGAWNPGTLVTGTPAAGEYAVRVDVAPATTVPAYSPSAPTPVVISAPYVNYTGWKVMNRSWDVILNNVGQEPSSPVGVRSYYTTADFDAIRGATAGINAGEHNKLTFYKLKNIGTTSATALASAHAGVTAAQFVEFNLLANPSAWAYTSLGGGVHQAQFAVDEFSGGGGGGAPDGTGAFPVELTSFTGTPAGNAVLLEWATASEQNSAKFVVERSADNATFEALGEEMAAGNSNTVRNYQFADLSPLAGISYYRLRQLDMDGAEHLSNTIEVAYAPGQVSLTLVPNPATVGQTLTVLGSDAEAEISLRLYTVAGDLVTDQTLPAGVRSISLPVLPAGLYLYRLKDNGTLMYGRLIVQ